MRPGPAARLTLALLALLAVAAPAASAQAPYAIPPDNPYVNTPGARGEVFVYGMRNPYRWSFDRQTGDLYVGDVGGTQEEVTFVPRAFASGANLGWNCLSGTATESGCTPGRYVPPAHTYPSSGDVVIGGYVSRAPSLPAFSGSLPVRAVLQRHLRPGPAGEPGTRSSGPTRRRSPASARTAWATCTPPR